MSQTNKRNRAILKAQEILSNPEKYIIVDTETSGLGDRAEVLEICAMFLQGEVVLDHFFKPTVTISAKAIATHGLTKEICGTYLKDSNLENVSLNNRRQVERVDSIVKVKPNVPLEQLPDSFKKTSVDHYVVKRLWKKGELDEELFSYEKTWSIKIKNQ